MNLRVFWRIFFCLFVLGAPPVWAQKSLRVERVIDGDTVKLSNGEHIRLVGIDTPESSKNAKALRDSQKTQQDINSIIRMGKEAKQFLKGLVEGKEVELKYDVQKRDRYGRLLAYVFVGIPVHSGIDVQDGVVTHPDKVKLSVLNSIPNKEKDKVVLVNLNAYIIQSGYASPMTVPPNVKYAQLFQKLFSQARQNKRGLWAREWVQ